MPAVFVLGLIGMVLELLTEFPVQTLAVVGVGLAVYFGGAWLKDEFDEWLVDRDRERQARQRIAQGHAIRRESLSALDEAYHTTKRSFDRIMDE